MTSFALRTLHAVVASEWSEEVYIPLEVINRVALWITDQQNKTTGAFPETSSLVYDRNMDVRLIVHRTKFYCISERVFILKLS